MWVFDFLLCLYHFFIFLKYFTIKFKACYFVEMTIGEAVVYWLLIIEHGLREISLQFLFTFLMLFLLLRINSNMLKIFSFLFTHFSKGQFADDVHFAKQFAERINLIYFFTQWLASLTTSNSYAIIIMNCSINSCLSFGQLPISCFVSKPLNHFISPVTSQFSFLLIYT